MSDVTATGLAGEQYVLLTTFRRDGRAVPTPVWVAAYDGGLGVWTVADSGKVKRARRDGHVTIAACDRRGRPTGPVVDATATVLDAAGTAAVRAAVRRKYGVVGWIAVTASGLRRGRDGVAGIAIR